MLRIYRTIAIPWAIFLIGCVEFALCNGNHTHLPPTEEGGIIGGLMGMAVKTIFSAVGKQMQQASQQSTAVREQAAALIESDFRVQRALGGGRVQVSRNPISQSSSTTVINGQRSAAVTLLLPVQSSAGETATAEVSGCQVYCALQNVRTTVDDTHMTRMAISDPVSDGVAVIQGTRSISVFR